MQSNGIKLNAIPSNGTELFSLFISKFHCIQINGNSMTSMSVSESK